MTPRPVSHFSKTFALFENALCTNLPTLLAAACRSSPRATACRCPRRLAATCCCLLLLAAACCCLLLPAAARCCLMPLAAACCCWLLPACPLVFLPACLLAPACSPTPRLAGGPLVCLPPYPSAYPLKQKTSGTETLIESHAFFSLFIFMLFLY